MNFYHIHKFIGSILIFFIFTVDSRAEMTTSQIAAKYTSAVVTIISLNENNQTMSLGSGFFINTEGDIVTNYHVLEGCSKAIIKTVKGGKGDILEIVKADPDLDLLIAKTSLRNIPPLPLGDSDSITVGDDIVAIGNPAGLEGTISKGIISGIRKADSQSFIQITAPISPGSSGGPVFNMSGNVIGVATAYLDEGQNLNFAMPINTINSLRVYKGKLHSLPKAKLKKESKSESLIDVTEIHLNACSDITSLCSIDFALKNKSNYVIKNIKLLFIYKVHKREYSEDARQFSWKRKNVEPIKEWYDLVSYSTGIFKQSILPNLALQFTHSHTVKHFIYPKYQSINSLSHSYGEVDIRILDYDIDNSSNPSELLFK